MSQQLVELLGRSSFEELEPYVASSTISLAEQFIPAASSVHGMAALIVGQYDAAGVLRDTALRRLVLSKLLASEANELCLLIRAPTVNAVATLIRAFASLHGTTANTLFEWFKVPYQPDASNRSELSRRVKPAARLWKHQTAAFRELRQRLSDRSANILVHMPPGSGKLRATATAIVDLFRSSAESQTVIWCAADSRLCEAAFSELFAVWEDLGSRDVTIYRLFGNAPTQDLRTVSGGIVILDLTRFADVAALDRPDLHEFAKSLRCVVLNDAQHIINPGVEQVFRELRAAGSFNVVGLFSASGSYVKDIEGVMYFCRRRV